MTRISERLRAGLSMLAASTAPSALPAPTMVWSSSMNRITLPIRRISARAFFTRSSNSPRYLVPASMAARSMERMFFPSREAVEILLGLRDKYEAHHKLAITDEAVQAAVDLGERYLPDRFLPDKAIDLMDEACSRVRMECETRTPDLKELEDRLERVRREKAEAVSGQDFERAAQLRDVEEDFARELREEKARWVNGRTDDLIAVTGEDVAAVAAEWTGIPASWPT